METAICEARTQQNIVQELAVYTIHPDLIKESPHTSLKLLLATNGTCKVQNPSHLKVLLITLATRPND